MPFVMMRGGRGGEQMSEVESELAAVARPQQHSSESESNNSLKVVFSAAPARPAVVFHRLMLLQLSFEAVSVQSSEGHIYSSCTCAKNKQLPYNI